MSKSEVERFSRDLKSNEDLLREFSEGVVGLDQIVEEARRRGYDFDATEAKSFVYGKSQELDDSQLRQVAGGAAAGLEVDPVVVTNDPTVTVTLALLNAFAVG